MALREIKGQERAVRRLASSAAGGRVSHAYLFHGPEGVGKELAAKNFAKLLNCAEPRDGDACDFCRNCVTIEKGTHPDVIWVRPLGKARIIPIEKVQDFQKAVALKSHAGGWKIGIFADAHTLGADAASSLLKTLEEPPAHTVIILVSSRPEMLLPTILSRCQAVRFIPMKEGDLAELLQKEYSLAPAEAELLSRLSGGRFGEAVRAMREERIREAREFARMLSVDNPRYWFPVAPMMDFMEETLEKSEETVKWQLAERGLKTEGSPGEEVSDEVRKEMEAFSSGERRRRHEEILEEILCWYRDVIVWKWTGKGDLLIGAGPREEIVRFAESATREQLVRAVALIDAARRALRRNANFYAVMENLLVQLAALRSEKVTGDA